MAYTVSQSIRSGDKLLEYYIRGFETIAEANLFYDDIDLKHEYEVAFMASTHGEGVSYLVVQKELYDGHGTLDSFDYYDGREVENGS